MIGKMRWLGAVPLSFLAVAALSAPRLDDAKPATLASAPVKKDDTVRYKSTVEISGVEVKVVQTRKHTVKEVKENGDVVLTVANEGGKVTLNGSDMDIPGGGATTQTFDKNGKMLAYKPAEQENPYLSNTTLHLLVLVDQIILPGKEVKPGDSWTTEIDNPAVKGKKVTIKTTYVSAEKVENVPAWKIKQTLEADTEGGKMTAEVTAMLEAANGQVISAEQDVKGIPGQSGAVDWKGKLERVKASPAKADKS